jgi:hypothetical protein
MYEREFVELGPANAYFFLHDVTDFCDRCFPSTVNIFHCWIIINKMRKITPPPQKTEMKKMA